MFDGGLAQHAAQSPAQHLDVVVPPRVGQLGGVAARERAQAFGELVFTGHPRAVDEHGDHVHVLALERALDLEAHEVVRIVQAATTVGGRGARPARADHGDADLAGVHDALDVLDVVDAGLDRDVAEHPLLAEAVGHVAVELAGPARGVRSPVVDEDAGAAGHLWTPVRWMVSRCSLTQAACSVETRASTRSARTASRSMPARYGPAWER